MYIQYLYSTKTMKLLLSIIKKKGLKISEAANTRRTDNSLTKRKTTKRQTMVGKTLHRKLKIEKQEPQKTRM